jgi:sigma-54 dependent transcriptional regulator, acetoin dehydrogenase operon transcriptional activator AcoR
VPSPTATFSTGALLAMFQYGWPGNLEQLAQVVGSLIETARSGEIEVEDLPVELRPSSDKRADVMPIIDTMAEMALKDAKRVFETEYFIGLLRRTRGNMTLASRQSRVGRPYLYKKIREYGIEPDQYR